MENEITINNQKYTIVNNYNDAFDANLVLEKMTDYFDNFDIIVGDWAYGKLRLKGFNEQDNPNFKMINDAKKIEEYIQTNCAYGCKWFEIKKNK